MDAGDLTVRVATLLPMAEGRKAHDMLESVLPGPPGKIVLYTDDSYVEGYVPQSQGRPDSEVQ
jgi:hypothetical protein